MNKTDFTSMLQNPETLTSEQSDAVKSIISEFPYFQPARAVYLKALKDQNSFKYNQELKTTAAYTTDRSILFDYITSEEFIQNEISEFIKQNTTHLNDIDVEAEDISVNRSTLVDDNLHKQIEETDGALDPNLFQPKEIKKASETPSDKKKAIESTILIDDSNVKKSPEAVLNLGKPFQFNKTEKHSFNEWLKISHFKPIEREEVSEQPIPVESSEPDEITTNTPEDSLEKQKKFDLIDKFIQQNPRISPVKDAAPKGNLANEQMIQPEALMTETLARIYVEQKNYKKAIQSYKILSLKYPEKSGFFADQIKAVEQLRDQNK
ncbi:hypothetical protein PK35_12270 [Tamlana nanhaiensis]|uniref:Tetratricopeptide repeat protein n=1 Tax=Neotamlana nanhaiensis TaxID=1382798 RepID=A0A0D7W3F4_9FLAO|nr:hypothetical protein [Tamlana nanhaiensis]KJD32200.1 hypothetical protein PK35_11385 [Tamlana nanhaiensis]KJD32362.1 hypothetical protein PK35_12270 [Tamlana nanhaiensis]